eukprot:TRINITY_DN218_c0_g1_i2.p1 TRINITY_DN218_c0_g1~~TRINITY_DN218_c0_g1_i2.p1  ORF type:complete len:105 (-),score=22.32 TRINITY_DN218_c0_g1_i2:32-346(-)
MVRMKKAPLSLEQRLQTLANKGSTGKIDHLRTNEDKVLVCRSLTQRGIVLDEKPHSSHFQLTDIFVWDRVHPSFWKFGLNSDELSKPKQDNNSVRLVMMTSVLT